MKRVAIIGCRPPKEGSPTYKADYATFALICEAVVEYVNALPPDTVIVSGGADGVDSVAAAAARERGLEVKEHFPDYEHHGSKMAPLVRNIVIVDDSDEVVAFPAPWSTGTWHAVGVARDKDKNPCVMKIVK